jgi:dissimilatory sulfite reductase (desulfoviridin) alpha/beta subunit
MAGNKHHNRYTSCAVVKKILAVYKGDARDWERVGEWVERIGWPAFFEKIWFWLII